MAMVVGEAVAANLVVVEATGTYMEAEGDMGCLCFRREAERVYLVAKTHIV